MKTLVTGATGLLGSELVRQLISRGDDVRVLTRTSSQLDLLDDLAGQIETVPGDVTNPASLESAMAGVSHVYHVAGYIGFGGRFEWRRLYAVNVEGTANVVNAAFRAGVQRLVHTSSMAAFGRSERPQGVIDESAEWQETGANTPYARSKYLGELEVYRGIAEGLDAVIVNPALIFGVGRTGENTVKIAEQVRDRKVPAIPTGGTNVVDVIDVADGHIRAMERGATGERYFLGGENRSWRDIIQVLADVFGVQPPRFTVPPAVALGIAAVFEAVSMATRTKPLITMHTARTANRFHQYDNSKAVRELGCSFRSFDETARRLAVKLG